MLSTERKISEYRSSGLCSYMEYISPSMRFDTKAYSCRVSNGSHADRHRSIVTYSPDCMIHAVVIVRSKVRMHAHIQKTQVLVSPGIE
ncbi:hypothetical protein M3J09_001360 [Ascochyta lentis]